MGNVFYWDWEPALMVWLQEHLGTVGITLAKFSSMFGEELFLVAILGFLYWSTNKQLGLRVGVTLLTASLWNPMAKNIARRLRPYMVHDEIACLKAVDTSADIMDISAQGFSFPSGHSASATSVYGTIAAQLKKKWLTIAMVLLCVLVGVSRFCVGVHYPTDVLAGWALGILAMCFISFLSKRIKNRAVFYLILIGIALPGALYCTTSDYFTSLGMMIGLAFGEHFEARFVRFENTSVLLFRVLRLIGGVAGFFLLNTLLKMPFSSDFLSSGTMAAYAVRTVRYAIVIFLVIGVYPMLFAVVEKRGKKTDARSAEN